MGQNRLDTINPKIFIQNKHLKIVNLSENKFDIFNDYHFLISDSIEILNLRGCQISHFYASTFEELTNIRTLDLSHNLLITLDLNNVRPLRRLDMLDLNNNQWICDNNLETVRKWLENHKVEVLLRECKYVV